MDECGREESRDRQTEREDRGREWTRETNSKEIGREKDLVRPLVRLCRVQKDHGLELPRLG